MESGEQSTTGAAPTTAVEQEVVAHYEKPKILQRPDFKKTVFIGVQGKEESKAAMELVKAGFPDHHIYVMDGMIFGQVTELFIKRHTDWKEKQGILTFTSNPKNIRVALETDMKIKNAVGTGWFGLKDLVDNTAMDYKQATSILELQFAFGMLVKDESGSRTLYKSVGDLTERIAYVESVEKGMAKELKETRAMIKRMKTDLATPRLEEPQKASNLVDHDHPDAPGVSHLRVESKEE